MVAAARCGAEMNIRIYFEDKYAKISCQYKKNGSR